MNETKELHWKFVEQNVSAHWEMWLGDQNTLWAIWPEIDEDGCIFRIHDASGSTELWFDNLDRAKARVVAKARIE